MGYLAPSCLWRYWLPHCYPQRLVRGTPGCPASQYLFPTLPHSIPPSHLPTAVGQWPRRAPQPPRCLDRGVVIMGYLLPPCLWCYWSPPPLSTAVGWKHTGMPSIVVPPGHTPQHPWLPKTQRLPRQCSTRPHPCPHPLHALALQLPRRAGVGSKGDKCDALNGDGDGRAARMDPMGRHRLWWVRGWSAT